MVNVFDPLYDYDPFGDVYIESTYHGLLSNQLDLTHKKTEFCNTCGYKIDPAESRIETCNGWGCTWHYHMRCGCARRYGDSRCTTGMYSELCDEGMQKQMYGHYQLLTECQTCGWVIHTNHEKFVQDGKYKYHYDCTPNTVNFEYADKY